MRTVPPKRQACYTTGNRRPLEIIGTVLIAVGVILLFCCIPGWAWCALIGVAFVVVGYFLLKFSKAWR